MAEGVRRHGHGPVGVAVDKDVGVVAGGVGQAGEVQQGQEVVRVFVEALCPVEPRVGEFLFMPPRMCTTLPLAMTRTPVSRSGASFFPRSRW